MNVLIKRDRGARRVVRPDACRRFTEAAHASRRRAIVVAQQAADEALAADQANVEVVAGDDLRGGTRTNTFAPNSMTTSISAP